ncbi:nitrogenase cofactor biosynthesis protein NifB [Azospirillum soli]|uniref:nitrogenase cofactor biosynthesis protein NifB n=1 Tax=Azospirillum soli TaxID=1304799 RepID=UPI001AE1761A|nr:nitrogenase cofactor biosynthesis protein NifB [Azospirillum soli]MBP2316506.1 nitrogenase cofactor biosynthesis protein NifB [Azospirillum soli]
MSVPAPTPPSTPTSPRGPCATACADTRLPPVAEDIEAKVARHPCYSAKAHGSFARMHVPVAPACNIQCNYCNRKYDCSNESRPGVTSERLTPEQAARKVVEVAAQMPQLSVVGIAGPGDPLAKPAAVFETLERIREALPTITPCLSTNGLVLADHIGTLKELGVGHVTITINAIDPDIAARIYPWVYFDGKRHEGRAGAAILLERQREGMKAAVAAGMLIKINSVMIPGINDEHLVAVNRAITAWGAFMHNIMPLISAPEHGTHFGLTGQREPTAQELEALRARCAGPVKLMRHCRKCRADAIGFLGEDRHAEFANTSLSVQDIEAGLKRREKYLNYSRSFEGAA